MTRPLAALNTARASEGFAIRVTAKAPRPLHFRYLHEADDADALIRHLIRVEPGAEARFLESGPAAARVNKVMEVDVADTGVCRHIRAQGRDHDRSAAAHIFARLGEESAFRSFTLTMNGKLTRNETVLHFTGDHATCHIAGASIGADGFRHDDTVFITHSAPHCESRQVFKKVLKEGAHGVFQGKILVEQAAQKTDGYQICQALLLDDGSEFDAKPELEIYADDVVCSHGSTSGAVDEDVLFYLRSRGIPERRAKSLMVMAFVDEAVSEIGDEALEEAIREKIGGWLDRHQG